MPGSRRNAGHLGLPGQRSVRGLLTICADCKRICDEEGRRQAIEVYVRDHSEATFSHGICPDCAREWYPDLADGPGGGPGKPDRGS